MENVAKELKINVPTAIIIAGLFIAGAILITKPAQNGGTNNGAAPQAAAPQQINIVPVGDKDHFYGNPKAKVVLVEFSDLECPFCKMFHPTIKKIVDDSRGEIAWVYRHFPLDSLHSKARKEAEATECAAEIGGNDKFFEYLDVLFAATPSNNGLDPAELPKLAAQIGLDQGKFETCLSSGKYKNEVEADYQDGLKVGVNGTPATVIMNTKGEKSMLVGAQPEDAVKAAIDKLK